MAVIRPDEDCGNGDLFASATPVVTLQAGTIVVENSDGSLLPEVRVYDAAGRILAILQSSNQAINHSVSFATPAPGTYWVKVANLPAWKVVVTTDK